MWTCISINLKACDYGRLCESQVNIRLSCAGGSLYSKLTKSWLLDLWLSICLPNSMFTCDKTSGAETK